jgi:hypothetical protein
MSAKKISVPLYLAVTYSAVLPNGTVWRDRAVWYSHQHKTAGGAARHVERWIHRESFSQHRIDSAVVIHDVAELTKDGWHEAVSLHDHEALRQLEAEQNALVSRAQMRDVKVKQ